MRHSPRTLAPLVAAFLISGLLGACSILGGDGASGRKYVVFFDVASSSLDAPARAVIAHAAEKAADNPAMNVQVASYAAAHGSQPADAALAAHRGDVVASALRADGVAANRIQLDPRPPSNEDPGVAARRVEIDLAN